MGLSKEPNIDDYFKSKGIIYIYLGEGWFRRSEGVDATNRFPQHGPPENWSFDDDEFIGNFGKSNKFKLIYDILNDTETTAI